MTPEQLVALRAAGFADQSAAVDHYLMAHDAPRL